MNVDTRTSTSSYSLPQLSKFELSTSKLDSQSLNDFYQNRLSTVYNFGVKQINNFGIESTDETQRRLLLFAKWCFMQEDDPNNPNGSSNNKSNTTTSTTKATVTATTNNTNNNNNNIPNASGGNLSSNNLRASGMEDSTDALSDREPSINSAYSDDNTNNNNNNGNNSNKGRKRLSKHLIGKAKQIALKKRSKKRDKSKSNNNNNNNNNENNREDSISSSSGHFVNGVNAKNYGINDSNGSITKPSELKDNVEQNGTNTGNLYRSESHYVNYNNYSYVNNNINNSNENNENNGNNGNGSDLMSPGFVDSATGKLNYRIEEVSSNHSTFSYNTDNSNDETFDNSDNFDSGIVTRIDLTKTEKKNQKTC